MAFKSLIIAIAIMALLPSRSLASDPSPLQDFCVAVDDSKNAVFVNGKFCKDPKLVVAEDFFKSGLNMPGNTSNNVGSAVTPVKRQQLTRIEHSRHSLARIDYAPYGLNPPHTHPRGTEFLVVLEGTLYVVLSYQNPWSKYEEQALYQNSTSWRCVCLPNRSHSFSIQPRKD
uniref:Germin 3 n=1 Tax=Solanum tuberosum TaxID=4113 RepID=M1BUZ1_SOLTU